MPKEKTLEEKLEVASSAVERALEARDKAIQAMPGGKIPNVLTVTIKGE